MGRRTLGRKIKKPPPGFPEPLRINGRLYFLRSQLEAYKQKLIAEAIAASRAGQGRDDHRLKRGRKAAASKAEAS